MDASFLESEFTLAEVKAALWNSSGSKATGHNHINFNFIKRPISLIGCIYKVISKLLASRLACIIQKIIRPNQMAFLSGRQILDGVLIANELVNYAKRENIKMLLFKIDFEKAFDNVNWIFLLHVKEEMVFSLKWRNWAKNCLSSTSISVLVIGSTTWLVLNDGEVNMSLWQYADNALILGKWSRRNVRNLVTILNCFQDVYGLDNALILGKCVSSNLYMVLMVGSHLIMGMVCSTKKICGKALLILDLSLTIWASLFEILLLKRVRDSGEWGFLWDYVSPLVRILSQKSKNYLPFLVVYAFMKAGGGS
nr:cysteine-rich receptor-like protein kinase [Tanacetum cinerariifolium]